MKLKTLPSKVEIQKALNRVRTSQRRKIVGSAFRERDASSQRLKVYVNLACRKHGAYPRPVKWELVRRGGGLCLACGHDKTAAKHRYSLKQVREVVKEKVERLGLSVSVGPISRPSDRRAFVNLRCKKHGEVTKGLEELMQRPNALCPKCGDERKGQDKVISFSDKQTKYKKRHPDSRLELLKEFPGPRSGSHNIRRLHILAHCMDCGREFETLWESLYSAGSGCPKCANKTSAAKRTTSVETIQKRLAELGLSLLSGYTTTHNKCRVKCNQCGETKDIKPNVIFNRRGMSCKCTRSIPDICRDLVASDLARVDAEVSTEDRTFLSTLGIIPDIWLRTRKHIVEVKYGEFCFGNTKGPTQHLKRRQQVLRQERGYVKTGMTVTYIIIAKKAHMVYVPSFLDKQDHYFLEDLREFRLGGATVFTNKTIKVLGDLYLAPILVKGIRSRDLPIYRQLRKRLFALIKNNRYQFPSQKDITDKLGRSIRMVDRALGLGRNSAMKDRCRVLKEEYGLDVSPKIRHPGFWSEDLVLADEKHALKTYLCLCRKLGRPLFASEIDQELGVPSTRVNRWLGLSSSAGMEKVAQELQRRGLDVEYVPQVKNLTPDDARLYMQFVRTAQNSGHCLGCENSTKKGAFLCDNCHANAKRAFPKLKRAERAIQFVETAAYEDVTQSGSEEFREKIRDAWKRKRPPEYHKLIEVARTDGCVLCGEKARYEPLCPTHLQRCKKVFKILKMPTSGREWQVGMAEYCMKLKADHQTIRKWLKSSKPLSAEAIMNGLSVELFLSQDWAQRYRNVLRYLARNQWPTEVKKKKGSTEAKWLNRTIRASEQGTSPDDALRNDLELLLILVRRHCKPQSWRIQKP